MESRKEDVKRLNEEEEESSWKKGRNLERARRTSRSLTLTEVPEEHIKEGDVDWLVAAAVLLDLTQHHLTGNEKVAGHTLGSVTPSLPPGGGGGTWMQPASTLVVIFL